jgi:hypothetical protein
MFAFSLYFDWYWTQICQKRGGCKSDKQLNLHDKNIFPKYDFAIFYAVMVIEISPYLLNGEEFSHSFKSIMFGNSQ